MSTPTERVTRVPLRGGAEIPQLGFGVFQVPLLQTAEVVREALAAGYRHIDTAAAYQNEQGVGEALRNLGLERERDDPVIERIAAAHSRTPAQVVIRWHLQTGNVVIPKSVTPERIRANFEVFDFELDEEQMREIASLERDGRIGPDPDTFLSP